MVRISIVLRTMLLVALALAVAACGPSVSGSGGGTEDYPSEDIRLIVQAEAGGTSDLTARTAAGIAEKKLGTNIVVENRPGAAGSIAMKQVASAQPDGYTLGYLPVEVSMLQYLGYDVKPSDYAMIAQGVQVPATLTVRADSPYETMEDFVRAAKEQPNQMSVGNSGPGSIWHAATGAVEQEAGVELDERGFVKTDDYLRTTAPNIWSVGDVAGKLQFTHAADEMGRIAVGNAFGSFRQRRFRSERTPWVTFTSPEVGRVGLSEEEAAERFDGAAQVAFLPMTEVDRAVAADETDGFLKVVTGPRWPVGGLAGGRIVGATVMCSTGGELIHEFALAIRSGMFPARMALTTHAYPTWSMGVQKVIGQFFLDIEGRKAEPARAGGSLRS